MVAFGSASAARPVVVFCLVLGIGSPWEVAGVSILEEAGVSIPFHADLARSFKAALVLSRRSIVLSITARLRFQNWGDTAFSPALVNSVSTSTSALSS